MRGGHGERRSRYQPVNGSATDRQTVALPIEERSRYLSPKGHATDRQKVALPFFRRTTGWLSHAENAEENMRGLSQSVPFGYTRG